MRATRLLMMFRSFHPKSAILHVLEDKFFKASVNRQEHLLFIIRSDISFVGGPEARQVHKNLVEAVTPYLRFRVIIDLRRAKGTTSDEVEKAIREVWFPTLIQFNPLVALVATAAGRLHVGRMFREHRVSGKVFTNEAEARKYLGLPEQPAT